MGSSDSLVSESANSKSAAFGHTASVGVEVGDEGCAKVGSLIVGSVSVVQAEPEPRRPEPERCVEFDRDESFEFRSFVRFAGETDVRAFWRSSNSDEGAIMRSEATNVGLI